MSSILCMFLASVATAVHAQTTATVVYYSSTTACEGMSLRCIDVPILQCCEAPPSPGVFHLSQVIAGFAPCIQLFFNNDGWGGCGTCSSGGACGRCYTIRNDPFSPSAWVRNNGCAQVDALVQNMTMEGNAPTCQEVNEAVTEDGRVFAVPKKATGLKDGFLNDLLALSPDDFHAKWNEMHLYREGMQNPLSIRTPIEPEDPLNQ